jgi:hypothetical protein
MFFDTVKEKTHPFLPVDLGLQTVSPTCPRSLV